MNFIKTLSNVKVLKLPGLTVNSNKTLNNIVDVVLKLKKLEIFTFGEINQSVEILIFLKTIERLFCKRGLRKICCKLTGPLRQKFYKEMDSFKDAAFDVQKFIQTNPYLEDVQFSSPKDKVSLIRPIRKWSAEKSSYDDVFWGFFI